jgi:hypothetical protein
MSSQFNQEETVSPADETKLLLTQYGGYGHYYEEGMSIDRFPGGVGGLTRLLKESGSTSSSVELLVMVTHSTPQQLPIIVSMIFTTITSTR